LLCFEHDLYTRHSRESFFPVFGDRIIHHKKKMGLIYARLDIEPVRAAVEANAQRMLLVAAKAKKDAAKENPTSESK